MLLLTRKYALAGQLFHDLNNMILVNYIDDDNSFFAVLKRCIILRQTATYAGRTNRSFVSCGKIEDSEYTDKGSGDDLIEGTLREHKNWTARLGPLLLRLGWFEHLDKAQQCYSVEDARDVRPFITSHTWSLEKLFCRSRNSRYVANQFDLAVVDTWILLEGHSERKSSYLSDGLHLNEAGNRAVYKGLMSAIAEKYPHVLPMEDGDGKYGTSGIPLDEELWQKAIEKYTSS